MELWDLYDENRVNLGKTMVRGEKQHDGVYRIVVHACIFNSQGQMLIQQRQPLSLAGRIITNGSFIPYSKSFLDLLFVMRYTKGVLIGKDTSIPTHQ